MTQRQKRSGGRLWLCSGSACFAANGGVVALTNSTAAPSSRGPKQRESKQSQEFLIVHDLPLLPVSHLLAFLANSISCLHPILSLPYSVDSALWIRLFMHNARSWRINNTCSAYTDARGPWICEDARQKGFNVACTYLRQSSHINLHATSTTR